MRVIVWAGAPVPVFQPRRGERQGRARAARRRGTKIQCQLDSCTRMMHCHHEKLVIVDDELAFVGGIDLTTLAGDRYDSNAHPHKEQRSAGTTRPRCCAARSCVTSPPTSRCAGRRPRARRSRCRRRSRPPATRPCSSPAPCPRAPTACSRAASSPCSRPTSARCAARSSLIYLENQFLWSPEIVHILEAKLRRPPCDDFRVVVLLPHKANNGQDDTRGMLGRLVAADDGRQRLPRGHDPLALRRALRAAVRARQDRDRRRRVAGDRLGQPQRALALQRHRGRRRHLRPGARARPRGCGCGRSTSSSPRTATPAQLVDSVWRPIASEQLERQAAGAPLTHHLVELPGVSRRSRRLLGPLDALVVDG